MVFSSPLFLFLFLPLVLGLYYSVPRPARNGVLVLASVVFYAWGEPRFAGVMFASIIVNYVLGLLVQQSADDSRRKRIIVATVIFNIGLLGFYKYGQFVTNNLNLVLTRLFPSVPSISLHPVELPLGISFFTFHALSYVIDIYRRQADAQRRPFLLALYISFFPQLVAGPIVRYHEIAGQLVDRRVRRSSFVFGAERFVLGLGKKILIANTVALSADSIFSLPANQLTTKLAWLGVGCYALQIYFDFSGYSDMAIGLAALFGFRFPENFNYPYVSRSLTEFWRRWHISLSSWFRDYLYIPLGGNKISAKRTYANLLIVFLLCGLWHGANWTFVIWGLFHGLFLVIERLGLTRLLEKSPRPIGHLYTMILILVGWTLFRADTLGHAYSFLHAMAGFGVRMPIDRSLYIDTDRVLAIGAGIFGSVPWLPALRRSFERDRRAPIAISLSFARVAAFAAIFLACAMRLSASTYNPFIYFRF